MSPPGLTLKIRRSDPATGAPSGVEYVAPGVSGAPVGVIYHASNLQPLAVSGLQSRAGIYAAYVDTSDRSSVLLWRVGDPTPKVVVTSPGTVSSPTLAAAADGGLWIIWLDSTAGGETVQTRKLAADGATLGPIATLPLPPSPVFVSVAQISGIAQPGGVEIVLAANNGAQRIFATLAVPPASAPTTPTAPATATVAPAVATSLSPTVKVLRKAVSVTLRAPAGATASGTIQLKAKVTTGKKAKPKIVGSVSFKLAAGQTRSFRVALNKSGKNALARIKRLKVSVVIIARDATGKAQGDDPDGHVQGRRSINVRKAARPPLSASGATPPPERSPVSRSRSLPLVSADRLQGALEVGEELAPPILVCTHCVLVPEAALGEADCCDAVGLVEVELYQRLPRFAVPDPGERQAGGRVDLRVVAATAVLGVLARVAHHDA